MKLTDIEWARKIVLPSIRDQSITTFSSFWRVFVGDFTYVARLIVKGMMR